MPPPRPRSPGPRSGTASPSRCRRPTASGDSATTPVRRIEVEVELREPEADVVERIRGPATRAMRWIDLLKNSKSTHRCWLTNQSLEIGYGTAVTLEPGPTATSIQSSAPCCEAVTCLQVPVERDERPVEHRPRSRAPSPPPGTRASTASDSGRVQTPRRDDEQRGAGDGDRRSARPRIAVIPPRCRRAPGTRSRSACRDRATRTARGSPTGSRRPRSRRRPARAAGASDHRGFRSSVTASTVPDEHDRDEVRRNRSWTYALTTRSKFVAWRKSTTAKQAPTHANACASGRRRADDVRAEPRERDHQRHDARTPSENVARCSTIERGRRPHWRCAESE